MGKLITEKTKEWWVLWHDRGIWKLKEKKLKRDSREEGRGGAGLIVDLI